MRAVADQIALVVRLDPEFERAAVDKKLFRCPHPHADRGRRDVADLEAVPRLWWPGGSKCSTAASAAASIRLIITGVASTLTRPEPIRGAVC